MPELSLNTPAKQHPYYKLNDFAKGYIEAMFFTNGDTGSDKDNLLNDLGVVRITKASIAAIDLDCYVFEKQAHDVLQSVYQDGDYDEAQAGRDFWFTSQGHGVGFWCRDELTQDQQDQLTAISSQLGEANVDAYKGWIYYN